VENNNKKSELMLMRRASALVQLPAYRHCFKNYYLQ